MRSSDVATRARVIRTGTMPGCQQPMIRRRNGRCPRSRPDLPVATVPPPRSPLRPPPAVLRRRTRRRRLPATELRPRTGPLWSRPMLFRRRSALRTTVWLRRRRTNRKTATPATGCPRQPGGSSPPRPSGPCGIGIKDAAHTSIRRPDAAAARGTCSRSTTSGPGRGAVAASRPISACSAMRTTGIVIRLRRFRDRGRIDPQSRESLSGSAYQVFKVNETRSGCRGSGRHGRSL